MIRAFLLGLLLVLAGCEADRPSLRLAHLWQEPAPGLARKVQTTLGNAGFEVELIEAATWGELRDLAMSGEADLAIIEEPDGPIARLMTVAPLYPSVLHVL
ncbi:MAG: hypothetical protein AAGA61_05055, partial [Pseudomonadota bacterium]